MKNDDHNNTFKRCTKCVLPNSLPSVKLDQDGICNHCNSYHNTFADWDEIKAKKETEFEDILIRAKRQNQIYDCLIPLSGGKDSTYTLYLCDKIYNLKCLCVTFDNGFLSNHAKMNIKNAIEATNADHIFYSLNRNIMLNLYKLFLKKCGNFCPPCLRGIGAVMRTAEHYNIPLTISGTGKRVAYLSTFPELYQDGNLKFFKNVIRGEPVEDYVGQMILESSSWNIKKVIRIACNLLHIPNPILPHYISLYDYIDTSIDTIYPIISKEMGWQKPENKFEHMDCQLHDIANYLHILKFPELSPHTLYNSSLIRLGIMNRSAVLKTENNGSNPVNAPSELDSFLNEIEMSTDEFISSTNDWRKIYEFRSKDKITLKSLYHKIVHV